MGVALMLRIMFGVMGLLVVGTVAVFGLQFIEPIGGVLSTPASLGWANPLDVVIRMFALGAVGLLLVIIIWLVAAPIRNDRRQTFR